MSKPAVKAIPEGMHSLTPHLVCADAAAAIEFYKKAFHATDASVLPGPGGKIMHAHLRIGDSSLMLMDEYPEFCSFGPKSLKGSPVTIHLYVENADAVYNRAVAAGAIAKMPMEDTFWGDRYGVLEDPFGHSWSIATHIRDMSLEEIREGAQKMCAEEPAK